MVQVLPKARKDTFYDYSEAEFRKEFAAYFDVEQTFASADTVRTLFLFRRRGLI